MDSQAAAAAASAGATSASATASSSGVQRRRHPSSVSAAAETAVNRELHEREVQEAEQEGSQATILGRLSRHKRAKSSYGGTFYHHIVRERRRKFGATSLSHQSFPSPLPALSLRWKSATPPSASSMASSAWPLSAAPRASP